jgi:hypothetical protein
VGMLMVITSMGIFGFLFCLMRIIL